jgi:hypothetical protein
VGERVVEEGRGAWGTRSWGVPWFSVAPELAFPVATMSGERVRCYENTTGQLPPGNGRTHRSKTPWAHEWSSKGEEPGEAAAGAGPGRP